MVAVEQSISNTKERISKLSWNGLKKFKDKKDHWEIKRFSISPGVALGADVLKNQDGQITTVEPFLGSTHQ